jgi:AraC-like DNA-binding protein
MKSIFTDPRTDSDLLLIHGESSIDRNSYVRDRDRAKKYFTIAWNRGEAGTVVIDGDEHPFPANTIVPLMFDQAFSIENAEKIVAWQFNREFYCIVDHDAEVSCVGFLFAAGDKIFIPLDVLYSSKTESLLHLFISEFHTRDTIQQEMLLVLLKRLIIDITRIARKTYITESIQQDEKFDLFRQFNLLVEGNFRAEHSVNFYARQLNKSPKTLANLFPLYNQKTPLQIIQGRIIMEARRLLSYTDKTVKQITYELGFEDPNYFCTFFKRATAQSPVEFRKKRLLSAAGK